MHYFDLIFLVALFLVQPIHGAISSRKLAAEIAAGNEVNRISLFNETIAMQWIALVVLGLAWGLLGRPIEDLGFRSLSASDLMIGSGSVIVIVAVLLYSWYYIRNLSTEEKSDQKEAAGDMLHYLPQNDREFSYSMLVSITAGIVEEIVYRGFVFWVLLMHVPVWAAVLISSLGFGLAHVYQGIGGVVKVGFVGVVFACLYVFTGSIWFPILAHILVDVIQMATIRELYIDKDQKKPDLA